MGITPAQKSVLTKAPKCNTANTANVTTNPKTSTSGREPVNNQSKNKQRYEYVKKRYEETVQEIAEIEERLTKNGIDISDKHLHEIWTTKQLADMTYKNKKRTFSLSNLFKSNAQIKYSEVLSSTEIQYLGDIKKLLALRGFKKHYAGEMRKLQTTPPQTNYDKIG